mgnify:CR=1 FL=1
MVKQQLSGLLLLLFGIGLAAGAVMGPFGTYQDVQSHDTTQATITSADMESATERDDGETEVEYYPRIDYEYTVGGTTYTDTRIFHPSQVNTEPGELEGKEFDSQSDARNVVDRYQSGSSATVRYDPDDPETSYLEDPSTDLLISTGMMGLFGLLAGGAGIGGLLGIVSLNDD